MSPTSSTSSKKSWATAIARYWFGESYPTLAQPGQTVSYSYGHGNPSGISAGTGGLVSLVYPAGHAQNGTTDKDLDVYAPFASGSLVGFNIIGVSANGMIIVLTKDDKKNFATIYDAQSLLLASGVQYAFVTDGGGSTACWTYDKGFFSKAHRHQSSPDNKNTITSYIIFSPSLNP